MQKPLGKNIQGVSNSIPRVKVSPGKANPRHSGNSKPQSQKHSKTSTKIDHVRFVWEFSSFLFTQECQINKQPECQFQHGNKNIASAKTENGKSQKEESQKGRSQITPGMGKTVRRGQKTSLFSSKLLTEAGKLEHPKTGTFLKRNIQGMRSTKNIRGKSNPSGFQSK